MTLTAFLAAGLALFCAGFLTCLCINRNDARRIPEHPTLRGERISLDELKKKHGIVVPALRLVESPPYDQDRTGG